MSEITLALLAALVGAAVFGWLCHRWGRKAGYADGFDKGRQQGLLERDDVLGTSGKAIGGSGEPVEPV